MNVNFSEALKSWESIIRNFLQEKKVSEEKVYLRNENLNLELLKIQEKQAELSRKYEPRNWLEWAACNAKSISFATHVSKLTHSAIDGSSFNDKSSEFLYDQLSTSSLLEKAVDGAVRGNQYAPIFQFLELKYGEERLANKFRDEDCQILQVFSESEEELKYWNIGFREALKEREISAHSLLKQIYFPIDNYKTNYHLLCNLVSSSIAHRLFEKVRNNRKEKGKYDNQISCFFPKAANLGVTASNHGNASQLNGKRAGRLKLLSCQPPIWQSQLTPPVYKRSLFDESSIAYQAKEDIDYLRDFLLRFEKIELSIKNPERKKWIDSWVSNIIDEVLFYSASIRSLPAGWSATPDIRLKIEHRLFLDPDFENEEFQVFRANSNWPSVVCADFAKWLNRSLAGKDKKFTPQSKHTCMWRQLFEQALREFFQSAGWDREESLEKTL